MILVDTSVWAQHIRRDVQALRVLLEAGEVLAHPFVIGELAIGNLPRRASFLRDLHDLPSAVIASDQETLHLIDQFRLFGSGLGYIDAHLVAATQLSAGCSLWAFDKALNAAATRLGIGFEPPV